ncbi:hypothetical protein ACJZ2D_010739 [Fusarium nematophilum]
MASSNPFRKKVTAAADTITVPASPPSAAAARFPALDAIETAGTPPPPTSFHQAGISVADSSKSKTTKKVRVLSPPPLSPDSPEWAFATPPSFTEYAAGEQKDDDPFDATSTDDSDREIVSAAGQGQARDGGQVPGNPFSKTLRDLESPDAERKLEKERKEEGNVLKAANTVRRSLDVNSFKRLLMTGNSGSDKPTITSRNRQSLPPPARHMTDSSSVSLASTQDSSKGALTPGSELQETSLISQGGSDTPEDDLDQGSISDSSTSLQVSGGKKPPPPPSSRHGKSIKLDLIGGQAAAPEVLASMTPSDMNKPLPPAPIRRSLDDGTESPFDREAAGKIPEVDVDMDPGSPNPQGSSRKAVPAPPPRRGHARGESKAFAAGNPIIAHQMPRALNDENISRSSSLRSRTDHSRHDSHAPAPPPPPRRSHHSSRQSTQIPPGVAASFNTNMSQSSPSSTPSSELDTSTTSTPTHHPPALEATPPREAQSSSSHQPGAAKSWAPPPPPARNVSVRRPASVRSIDSTSRRISFESKAHSGIAPPPPPRRQRGSSRGSMEGPPRKTSIDGVGRAESSRGADILADLDALQREVDALRGKLG